MSWLIKPQPSSDPVAATSAAPAPAPAPVPVPAPVPPPAPSLQPPVTQPEPNPYSEPPANPGDPMDTNDGSDDSESSSSDSDVEFVTAPSTSAQHSSLGPGGPNASSASQRRHRITRACDQCRPRRAQCTGFKPCFPCDQRGAICTYNRPYTRGTPIQPPPPPPGADGTERNYALKKKRSRRRQREPFACDHCRVHKIPCAGKLPCDACFKGRLECTFKLRFRIYSHPSDGTPTAPHPQLNNQSAPEIEPLQYPNRYCNEEVPPLVFLHRAWRKIAVAQALGAQMSPYDFRGSQLVLTSGDLPFSAANNDVFPNKLEMWYMLQDRFWSGWTETYHFIHRLTAKAWLDTVYRNWCAQAPLESGITHAKATVALMTMALGTMFYHESVIPTREELSWKWLWTIANGDQIFRMTIRLTDNEPGPPTLESVQARLLQAMYLLSTCRVSHACYIFGNAVSMLTALGLHRCRGKNRGLGPEIVLSPEYAKVECEKRTFWSTFILDRQLSMMTGRPPYFTSDTISQVIPDPVNDEDMGRAGPFRPHKGDCYLEALVEHVKLIKIVEKILTQVYTLQDKSEDDRLARAVQLGKAIDEWREGWPFLMSKVKPSMLQVGYRRQHTLLRLAYWHAQILTYRPFLTAPYPTDPETRRTADTAIYTCLEACRAVLSTALRLAREQAESDNSHFHTLLYLHHITYVAAAAVFIAPHIRERQKLFGGEQNSLIRHSDEAMGHLNALAQDATKALVQGTNNYSPARLWVVILKELRQEAAAQIPPAPTSANSNSPAGDNANSNVGNGVIGANNSTASANNNIQPQPSGAPSAEQQPPQPAPPKETQPEEPAVDARDPDSASINEQLLEDALRAHWEATIQSTTTQVPTADTTSSSRDGSVEAQSRPAEEQQQQQQQQQSSAPQPASAPAPVIVPRLWDKWRTVDWVDLDSAAFGPISAFSKGDLPIATSQV